MNVYVYFNCINVITIYEPHISIFMATTDFYDPKGLFKIKYFTIIQLCENVYGMKFVYFTCEYAYLF